MDVFRVVLCLGLGLLLWRLQVRTIRPVQEFFHWGVDYPFHFLLTATLILVIWGVVGSSFGLQGLFLDEDPLTQVLLGATVMLLFAAIIVHYVALGTSRHGWWTSLHGLAVFLRGVNAVADPSRPVQVGLANGFLERLSNADIDAIEVAAGKYRTTARDMGAPADVLDVALREQLESEAFRVLITPAVLLEKGFGLVFLVGVVPTLVVPLVAGDPMGCLDRLPWLVGVGLGDVIGIVLGCWTTSWAAEAADWGEKKGKILAAIRRWAGNEATVSGEAARTPASVVPPNPAWLTLLLWFFLIHGVVNLALPVALTSRWIDWPEPKVVDESVKAGPHLWSLLQSVPWLPLGVLLGEVAAAGLCAAGVSLVPRLLGPDRFQRLKERWRLLLAAGITAMLRVLKARWLHQAVSLVAALLAIGSLVATILMSSEATHAVWLGLRGYASLGAMLFCWLSIFWLATHAAMGGGMRTELEQRAAGVSLCCLMLLHVLGAPAWFLAPLAAAAVIISGSRTLAGLWQRTPSAWVRPVFALGLTAAAGLSLKAGAISGLFPVAAGVWLGLAAVFLGSTALAGVASRQPPLLYPMTVLLGYSAFAIPYTALDERWQSAMPAAGSIACVVALLAALYTILNVARPRSVLLTIVALAATAVLLNGAALFVAPNEFKGTFPNMGHYYSLPTYLDSRDYFRDTTPSTARLRNRVVTEDFDLLARQGASERLATVYFTMQPLRSMPDGSHAVSVDVEDPRGRLRAVPGDSVRLAAEEWFTMRIDGNDCIALAEEPFYRKIFAWFRYETLHMVRNGILRGPTYPLVREDESVGERRAGLPELTMYRLITGDSGSQGAVDADVLGLRILGLATQYRQAGADYALIAINWTGRVTAARRQSNSDVYTVEFVVPGGGEPLDEEQLRTMASWMERCHLDVLRPPSPVLSAGDTPGAGLEQARPSDGRTGECLVLEDARTEAPVPVGVFFAGDARPDGYHPAFAPYWPVAAAIGRTIDAMPAPAPVHAPLEHGQASVDPDGRFTLRSAHDRGLFASPDGAVARPTEESAGAEQAASLRVALYNAGRLRRGDQIILSWNGRDDSASGPGLEHGGVFELMDLRERSSGDPGETPGIYPPGAVWAELRPVSQSAATAAAGGSRDSARDPFLVGQWQLVRLLNNTEVLLAWKNVVGGRWKDRKPKLVIVTVSGGGIRASVWTSVVLRKLEATLGPDFPYHIRLITGASGGMVAGSYYATSLARPPDNMFQGGTATFADLHGTGIDEFVNRMATDQLDAVAGRMLFADLPGTLSPFERKNDRGRTLEQTWIRWTGGKESPLGRSLQSYAADERMGWRPSMVYTPMMVEDGRRLLISNLDMAFATRNVGGLLLEPSSRKIERPTIQGGDFDLSIHEEDDVFSLSAVEFFRLFPEAHDFQVTTAVRMSASFPWVSPAINLPTLPPRRVVDAAYYDNYGVNLAALWLSKMSSWLEANTSGVLVVQVRDRVSQGARTEIDFDRLGADDSVLDRLVWHGGSKVIGPGLQALSTPLIGVTNARQWTMAFRNDEQVDLQDLLFDDRSGRDFFRTVVFECPVDVSLNWKLTDREKAILIGGFGRVDGSPREELSRVTDYMTGKDAYEFHKWLIDHRNDASFQKELKNRYDEQLQSLGITATDRLSVRESQSLYENVMKNLKRLELMADWWNQDRESD